MKEGPSFFSQIQVKSSPYKFNSEEAFKAFSEACQMSIQNLESICNTIFQSCMYGIVCLDKELRYVVWNPFMESITGKRKEEVVGRKIDEVFPGWEKSEQVRALAEAAKTGRITRFTKIPYSAVKGYYNSDVLPVRDKNNDIIGVVSFVYDVTELVRIERELENQRNFLQKVSDTHPDLIYVLNLKNVQIEYASGDIQKVLGIRNEHIYKKRVFSLLKTLHPDELKNAVKFYSNFFNATDDEVREKDYRIKATDGSYKVFSSRNKVFERDEDGNVSKVIIVSKDLTRERAMELENEQVKGLLAETYHFLEAINETSPHMVYIYDLENRKNVYINKEIIKVLGYSIEDYQALGENLLTTIIHPEDLPKLQERQNQIVNDPSNSIYDLEYRVIGKNGHWIWFFSRAVAFKRNAEGKVTHMLGIGIDISSQKKIQEKIIENKNIFHRIIEGTHDPIAALDVNYNFITFNSAYKNAFESIFNSRIEEGGSIKEALKHLPVEQQSVLQIWERALNGEEFTAIREYGDEHISRRVFEMNFYRLHDVSGHTMGAFFFGRDITEKIKTQNEILQKSEELNRAYEELKVIKDHLSNLNKELEEIVNQRTKELSTKIHELEKLNETLDNFVYMAAHDLRSPIINLKSLVEMFTKAGEQQKEILVDAVKVSVNKLEQTIKGMIEVLEIQSGNSYAKVLDLENIVDTVMAEYDEAFRSCGGLLKKDIHQREIIYVEAFLISIVRNLVSNSIKYRAEERSLEISITTLKLHDYIVLKVTDNGSGINMEKVKNKIFKPFSRLTNKADGKGIGLHLIKSMLEKNGGYIEIESEVGVGTCFLCYLKEYELQQTY